MTVSGATALTAVVFMIVAVVHSAIADGMPRYPSEPYDRVVRRGWLAFSIAMALFIAAAWIEAFA